MKKSETDLPRYAGRNRKELLAMIKHGTGVDITPLSIEDESKVIVDYIVTNTDASLNEGLKRELKEALKRAELAERTVTELSKYNGAKDEKNPFEKGDLVAVFGYISQRDSKTNKLVIVDGEMMLITRCCPTSRTVELYWPGHRRGCHASYKQLIKVEEKIIVPRGSGVEV